MRNQSALLLWKYDEEDLRRAAREARRGSADGNAKSSQQHEMTVVIIHRVIDTTQAHVRISDDWLQGKREGGIARHTDLSQMRPRNCLFNP